jgi:hypothetical protein
MSLPEQRRRQILDYGPEKAPRFDARPPGDASAPRNNWVQDDTRMKQAARLKEDRSANEDICNEDTCHEDTWVTGFVGRLGALIRDVGGSRK